MRTFKLTGVFAAGLICGLLMQWPSASAYDDRGGIAGGSGGGGGIAGSCTADIAPSPNGDGIVNAADLLAVINAWGACAPPCNPTGSWSNAVPPVYQCASGTFLINIQNWSFTQSGTTLQVTGGGIPGSMTGPAVICEAGNVFLVSLSAPMGCTVTCTLSGTFTSATHFNGTFTVTFSAGPGCQNCFNQSFNISATKQ
jgi:hypothetical protein